MPEKILITCPHCGKSFTFIPVFKTGSGDQGVQHSPGCMKIIRVTYQNGQIIKVS